MSDRSSAAGVLSDLAARALAFLPVTCFFMATALAGIVCGAATTWASAVPAAITSNAPNTSAIALWATPCRQSPRYRSITGLFFRGLLHGRYAPQLQGPQSLDKPGETAGFPRYGSLFTTHMVHQSYDNRRPRWRQAPATLREAFSPPSQATPCPFAYSSQPAEIIPGGPRPAYGLTVVRLFLSQPWCLPPGSGPITHLTVSTPAFFLPQEGSANVSSSREAGGLARHDTRRKGQKKGENRRPGEFFPFSWPFRAFYGLLFSPDRL